MTLLLSRATSFSPNNVEKDAAILTSVASRLKAQGEDVCVMDEDRFSATQWQGEAPLSVFSMGRKLATLMRLEQYGWSSVNSPRAVRNTATSRELTLMLLQSAGISVPAWWAYEPEEDEMFQCEERLRALLPGWVKCMRPDGVRAGDVVYVATPLEADTVVIERVAEGVTDLVFTQHVAGDLVKAYVVTDGDRLLLFRYFAPQTCDYSKFGDEVHNGAYRGFPIEEEALRRLSLRIADALGLQVFGFDAIVSEDGRITVIDVNDWPSFSKFREEAADAIFRLSTF